MIENDVAAWKLNIIDRMIGQREIILEGDYTNHELNLIAGALDIISMILHKVDKKELE